VLMGDPPPTGGDWYFRLLGIPVRVHPFFWLIALLLGLNRSDGHIAEFFLWILAVFLSVLVHEMGHALTMRAYGFQPRVTLYGLGGFASYGPGQSRDQGTVGQILISFAGPGSQFLLVAALVAILKATGHDVLIYRWGPVFFAFTGETVVSWAITVLLDDLMLVSVFWGALNLVPVYPLDGGQIAREILVAANPREGISQSLILSMVAAVAMMLVGAQLKDLFVILLFGYLGYASYQTREKYLNQRGW